jgi:hypothetical protein
MGLYKSIPLENIAEKSKRATASISLENYGGLQHMMSNGHTEDVQVLPCRP